MRRRLLAAMLVVAAVAVAGFGIPLALSVRALYREEMFITLSEAAAEAVVDVPGSFVRDNDPPELPDPAGDVNIALYDHRGRKLHGEGPAGADGPVDAALSGGAARRDRDHLVVAIPISDEEAVVGAIRTSISDNVVDSRVNRTWAAMAALGVGVLLVAGLLAARLSRNLVRPLAELRADADVIAAGGEIPARPGTGVVEIDAIQRALGWAAHARHESMVRERSVTADLAHQLRTPLASLRLRVENDQTRDGHDQQLVQDVLHDVDRLEQTIGDVLSLARDVDQNRDPLPLESLLREAERHWEPRLASAGRRLELAIDPLLPLADGSPAAVRQILDVLVDNSLIHGEGTVRLSANRVGGGAVIAVADQGRVIVNADEIFLRRNPTAAGSGIGLALARRLAEADGMRLTLADPGPGVVFRLALGGHTRS